MGNKFPYMHYDSFRGSFHTSILGLRDKFYMAYYVFLSHLKTEHAVSQTIHFFTGAIKRVSRGTTFQDSIHLNISDFFQNSRINISV